MKNYVNHRVARLLPPNSQERPRPIGSAIFSEHSWETIARSLRLSGRELQIVRGVFDDETDVAIAGRIGISLHTVHTHVERLHRKLSITDRPQLLLRVVQEFLTLIVSPENDLPPLCATHESRGSPFSP